MKKIFLLLLIICALFITVASSPVYAATQTCTALTPLDGTTTDASNIIQSCINSAAANDTVELPVGKYYVAHQINVNTNQITIETQGKNNSMPRCNNRVNDCAELIALPAFDGARAMILVDGESVTMDHIVLNGNQYGRNNQRDSGYKPANILAENNHFTYTNGIIKNALEIAAFWVGWNNITVKNNLFTVNGMRKDPYGGYVSDGLIVSDTNNSVFEDNTFINGGTDVSMIFGTCTNCSIKITRFCMTNICGDIPMQR